MLVKEGISEKASYQLKAQGSQLSGELEGNVLDRGNSCRDPRPILRTIKNLRGQV